MTSPSIGSRPPFHIRPAVYQDDMTVRIFNYNTLKKEHQFEAHSDYIRAIAVHPSQPCFLTSSDDMSIKLWDWDKAYKCVQTFEGHTHYVMAVLFNPKDTNTFASCSLDRTIKVNTEDWSGPESG